MVTRYFALLILIGVAPHARGEDASASSESGFYAGTGLGQWRVRLHNGSMTVFDDVTTLFKIKHGYAINHYLAIEADALIGTKANDQIGPLSAELRHYLLNGSVLASWPVRDDLSLSAKVGYAYVVAKRELSLGAVKDFVTTDESRFTYGVAATLFPRRRFGFRAEYDAIEQSGGSLNALTLSAIYRF